MCLTRSSSSFLTRTGRNFALRLVILSGLVILMMIISPLEGTTSAQLRHDGKILNLISSSSSASPPSKMDLERLNEKLNRMTLDAVLVWAYDTFGNQLVDVTSFGYSGMVLLHKLQNLGILSKIPIVTIDTLHLFPETYHFIETIVYNDHSDDDAFRVPKKNFHSYQPLNYTTRSDFDQALGVDFWKTHPDEYNYISKVEPTLRALHDFQTKAWITGRRRDQGGERSQLAILEYEYDANSNDEHNNSYYKLNPLAGWSQKDIWGYIRLHKVPYNPLYEAGYASVGDVMTTQRIKKGDGERSGRFVGLKHTECGIHSTRAKVQRIKEQVAKQQQKSDGKDNSNTAAVEDTMPSLPCPKCDYEVTPDNFEEIVIKGGKTKSSTNKSFLLLEFYSPLCGACQDFSPKFKQTMEALAANDDGRVFEIARFDVTYHDVPKIGEEHGFTVEGTPDLYLILRYGNDIQIQHYQGDPEVDPLLKWIKEISS